MKYEDDAIIIMYLIMDRVHIKMHLAQFTSSGDKEVYATYVKLCHYVK